jgi:predicted permease
MLEIYIKLLPVFAFFSLGVVLKTLKLASNKHGEFLLKFMFFATFPVLILIKLSQVHIGANQLYLPFINIAINLICMVIMLIVTRNMEIERKTKGVMLISSMILNNLFIFPFILAVYDDQAFSDAVIFDIGNGIMTLTLTYAVALSYGANKTTASSILLNILKLPVMWALALAIFLNINAIKLAPTFISIFDPFGLLTSPLILISLGIFFTVKVKNVKLIAITVFIRMFAGVLVGLTIATILGLQGPTFAIVVLCAAAPIGFNALTYTALAKLDMDFASSAVSISILIGIVTIPILMYLLQ